MKRIRFLHWSIFLSHAPLLTACSSQAGPHVEGPATGCAHQTSGRDSGSGMQGDAAVDCIEGQIEGELADRGSMPRRPLWVDATGIRSAHSDRKLGVVVHTLSRESSLELAQESGQVFPAELAFGLGGISAVGERSPNELAIAFQYMQAGVPLEGISFWQNGSKTIAISSLPSGYSVWDLKWDGQGCTAGVIDSIVNWNAARFAANGDVLQYAIVWAC